MAISKTVMAVAAIIIVLAATFTIYAVATYPRTIVNIPVSFTIGADVETGGFDQSILNDQVQLQVAVQNGAALWQAQILSGNQVVWEHRAALGEQQSYNSGWIQLSSGSYNFTFGTIGISSLDATFSVSSKGGFW
jgi:hypothetical protein